MEYYILIFRNILGRFISPISILLVYVLVLLFIVIKVILLPFVNIKVSNFFTLRVGHLIGENWLYAHENELFPKSKREVHIFFINQKISNVFLTEWIKSQDWNCRRFFIYLPVISHLLQNSYYSHSYEPVWYEINKLSQRSIILSKLDLIHVNKFQMRDFSYVKELFTNKGFKPINFSFPNLVKPHKKTALIFYRDESYLNSFAPSLYMQLSPSPNVRNNTWADYKGITEILISQGYKVIRMGRFKDSVELSHPHFFDYGGSSSVSAERDVELSLNSDLIITSLTGLDVLPIIYFNKPTFCLHHGEINNLFVSTGNQSPIYYAPKLLPKNLRLNRDTVSQFENFISRFRDCTDLEHMDFKDSSKSLLRFLNIVEKDVRYQTDEEAEINKLFWVELMKLEQRDYVIPGNSFETTIIDSRWLKNHDLDRILLSDK
jgi:putative glycosyltransferase (TIGR04372 family)